MSELSGFADVTGTGFDGFPQGYGYGYVTHGYGYRYTAKLVQMDSEKLKSYVTKYLSIQIKKNLPVIIKKSLTMRDKQG